LRPLHKPREKLLKIKKKFFS